MIQHWIGIGALAAMFVVATAYPVNMGIIAFVSAWLVGTLVAGLGVKAIIASFPADLYLTLAGITWLFALARNNGTVDWLVGIAVRAVGGRVWAIPWIMFFVTAGLTSVGAVSPVAVAIIAPIALSFAVQHGISPLMMGLLIVHGAQGGGFTPISIYGGITNKVVAASGLPVSPVATMTASFAVNLAVSVLLFFAFGGLGLIRRGTAATVDATAPPAVDPALHRYRIVTAFGLALLAVLTLLFKADIGFTSLTIGLVLSLMAPQMQKGAIAQVSWPEIMLIVGVSTYVGVLDKMGTITFVGNGVAGFASPLVAALLLLFVGAIVSAFASSTAVLGSLIPLAVPFLKNDNGVGAIGFIAAMAVASTIVDVSPFSTNGALVLASAKGIDRDRFFRQLLGYGALVTLVAPVVLWLLFCVL